MDDLDLDTINSVHIIGIGGIGVSALARMFLLLGKKVSGSDIAASNLTDTLAEEGADVRIGPHVRENLPPDADLLIYTVAMLEYDGDNPEYIEARERGIPALSYPEALGLLTKEKKTIAVAGTHGKTTTTAMIADILIEAGKEPSVVVGSLLSRDRGNFIGGKSDLFVVEACEYRDSFLNLSPRIGVITNIDDDHLDYFGTLENIQESFERFVERIPKDGFLVANASAPNMAPVLKRAHCRVVDYSLIAIDFPLSVIGEHNKENARAAYALAGELGVEKEAVKEALSGFTGVWRRQEYKGRTAGGAVVYDDYAHHPTEIRMTLEAFRAAFPGTRICAVFQPHLYSRTKFLLDDLADALSLADEALVLDIYAAREKKDETITSGMLVRAVNKRGRGKAEYMESFEKAAERVGEKDKNVVVLTIGAGDVYKIGERAVR